MFDGTLGKYTKELDAKPYHAKPFRILRIHKPTLKKEVNRLINMGLLKKLDGISYFYHI